MSVIPYPYSGSTSPGCYGCHCTACRGGGHTSSVVTVSPSAEEVRLQGIELLLKRIVAVLERQQTAEEVGG